MALATGLAVSTIYLLQPILHTLSQSLQVSPAQMGLVMTLTQIGYGLGILFLVPLGDVLPKKSLILKKLIWLGIAMIATGLAQDYVLMLLGSLAIGIFATAAQDIVPFAADLAPEKRRGEVVGKVMSGLLLGILLSRAVSGIITDLWGWRELYWLSGISIFMIALAVWAWIEPPPVIHSMRYIDLVKSTLKNFIDYPLLRKSILTQGCLGIAFSGFWTNLSFFLGQPPFALTDSHIGLFGLAGALGAFGAPLAGRWADQKGAQKGITLGIIIVIASFATMALFPLSLTVLIVGTVTFDLGTQMTLISHQSRVYALEPRSRSRFNALFVAGLFASFSSGSLLSAQVLAFSGWRGILLMALGFAILALILSQKE